jgi:hypothetical protein
VLGLGKSVIAALIVEHLKTIKGKDVPVLYFFFSTCSCGELVSGVIDTGLVSAAFAA